MQFRTEDLARLADGMFVHNHPPYWAFSAGDPRHRARLFSAMDLIFMYEVNLALMVAVTEERTYSVARPPGRFYLDPPQIEEELRDLIVRVRERRIVDHAAGRMVFEEASSQGSLANEVMDSLGAFYVYGWEEAS